MPIAPYLGMPIVYRDPHVVSSDHGQRDRFGYVTELYSHCPNKVGITYFNRPTDDVYLSSLSPLGCLRLVEFCQEGERPAGPSVQYCTPLAAGAASETQAAPRRTSPAPIPVVGTIGKVDGRTHEPIDDGPPIEQEPAKSPQPRRRRGRTA